MTFTRHSGVTFDAWNEQHGVFFWSPKAHGERHEVDVRRREAKQHHDAALKLLAEGGLGEYRSAERLLRLAVAAWPDNSRFQRALGNCISRYQSEHERAKPHFDTACQLQPDVAINYTARGCCSTAMGEMDAALEDFNTAVKLETENPKHGKYRLSRAVVCHRMGLNAQAVEDYTYCLENIRECISGFEILCNRGECHRKLGNIEESLKDLQTAQFMRMSYACQMSLGCSLLEKDDHRGARNAFEQAERLDRSSSAAVNNLGLVCYAQAVMASEEFLARQNKVVEVAKEPQKAKTSGDASDGGVAAEDGSGADSEQGECVPEDSDSDVDLNTPPMSPRRGEEDSPKAEQGEPEVIDKQSMSSSTVLSNMLFKPATVHGKVAKLHLARAIEAYNMAIKIQDTEQARPSTEDGEARAAEALDESGAPAEALQVVRFRGRGRLCTDRVLLVVSDHREAGTPVIDSSMLKPGEIYFNRGKANLACGELETALKDFDIALQHNTDNPEFPFYRGLVFEVMGNHEAARTWFNQALLRSTEYFPALLHAALVLHSTKMYKESIKRFEIALMIQPHRADVKEARGRVLQDIDNHVEALPALNDALSALPDSNSKEVVAARSRIYYAIAQSCLALRITNDAIVALEKSQQLGQGGWMVDNLKGLLSKSEGDYKAALKLLTKAVLGNYFEPRVYFDRAILLRDLGREEDAVRDLTRALDRHRRDNAALLFFRGQSYLSMKKYELAAEDFLRATRCMEGDTLVVPDWLWYGERFVTGDSRSPDITAELWYNLGVCLAGKYSNKEACSAFEKAVKYCPGHPTYTHEHAKALQAEGRCTEALARFTEVLRLQPDNSHALFRKALAHHTLKQYDTAAQLFEAAKVCDPGNPRVVVDYNALHDVHVIELCRPGEEREDVGNPELLEGLKAEDSWLEGRPQPPARRTARKALEATAHLYPPKLHEAPPAGTPEPFSPGRPHTIGRAVSARTRQYDRISAVMYPSVARYGERWETQAAPPPGPRGRSAPPRRQL
eukprot:jgi/Tetstr1/428582/TSEL_018575.t1